VTTKVAAMLAALGVVSAAFQRKADVYGVLNSQDADFKDLQQQVNAALALPDDPAPDAPPPPPPEAPDLTEPVKALANTVSAMLETVNTMNATLAPLNTKMDGVEDALGAIMASLPAAPAA